MEKEEGRPLECAGCKCLMGYSNQVQPQEGERFECLECARAKKAPFQERQSMVEEYERRAFHE